MKKLKPLKYKGYVVKINKIENNLYEYIILREDKKGISKILFGGTFLEEASSKEELVRYIKNDINKNLENLNIEEESIIAYMQT